MDRNLRGEIASELQRLRTDPRRGAELAHNLAGRRSIHTAKFSYRIVYRVDDNSCTITVESISRRKSVYNNLKRRHGAWRIRATAGGGRTAARVHGAGPSSRQLRTGIGGASGAKKRRRTAGRPRGSCARASAASCPGRMAMARACISQGVTDHGWPARSNGLFPLGKGQVIPLRVASRMAGGRVDPAPWVEKRLGPFFGGPRFRSPPSPPGPGPILLSLSLARGARRAAPVQPGDGPAGAAAPRARGRRVPRVAPRPGRGPCDYRNSRSPGADTPAGQASCCPPWAPNGAQGRKASLRSAGGRRAAPSAAPMRAGGGIKPAGRAAERRAAGRLPVSATRS